MVLACGCSDAKPSEPHGRTASPIIGGHDSGAGENAAVKVYATPGVLDAGLTDLFCSGYLVAPNLVVTARHCILVESTEDAHNLNCNPDGTIADPTDPRGTQTTPLPPSGVTVYLGNDTAALVPFAVDRILTEGKVGLCLSDIAFLVLATPALDVHPPIRAGAVHVGELFSMSGWGYTSDKATAMGRSALPTVRQTLDHVPINGVGPGLMPADSFSAPGGTGCFGDSGAGALKDGTVVGVFSRIFGPLSTYDDGLPACEPATSANYFTMIGEHVDLVRSAFAAAGWAPIFQCGSDGCAAGEQCDTMTGVCVADAGAETSDATTGAETPESMTGHDESGGGCAVGNDGAPASSPPTLLSLLVTVLSCWRRRSRLRS